MGVLCNFVVANYIDVDADDNSNNNLHKPGCRSDNTNTNRSNKY